MPPAKGNPKGQKNSQQDFKSVSGETEEIALMTPRTVSLSLVCRGDLMGGEYYFFAMFNGQIVLDGKWRDGLILESDELPINLDDPEDGNLVADKPLILLLRSLGGKGVKEPDPMLNLDNKAGATTDLFPLLLGEQQVSRDIALVSIATGERIGCAVEVYAQADGLTSPLLRSPLTITMLSVHCLPPALKEGTVYVSALGLHDICTSPVANFGMSLGPLTTKKIVWATASQIGYAAATGFNIPNDDVFIPTDLETENTSHCQSGHWNAMKRFLVDPMMLRDRLEKPFLIEVAGVPKTGKLELRGRYMGFVDAGSLLRSGEISLTVVAKLIFYNEFYLPENVQPLLEFPPSSAKATARDTDLVFDEYGHSAYIKIKFDLIDPIVPKAKIATFFGILGFLPPIGRVAPTDEMEIPPPPDDPSIDVRKLRKECGALAVHKELSSLACRGSVPMNQGIKRSAANKLLVRVRSMLKQFSPGDCSLIEWQDTVTAQHAASRRAVTASFAPQPPPLRLPTRTAASRCRKAGDKRIAQQLTEISLKVACNQPRPLMSKALRCLETRQYTEARSYVMQALSMTSTNKYLLWMFGALEFDKGDEGFEKAVAAMRIAVKGSYSDGTSTAIGWAALHALYHFKGDQFGAFVCARKMRKSYELPRDWKGFLQNWEKSSGEEESFWIPYVINTDNPFLLAAAFFLCLRGYHFSERLLQCLEMRCATRGSRFGLATKILPDIYYVRAASLLLRRLIDKALEVTESGILKFGPSGMLSQMRAMCITYARGWDNECDKSLKESENEGADPCIYLQLQGALGGMNTDPNKALQRAAQAHKLAPSAHSALTIARIYAKLGEEGLAERWAAASVKVQPLLADGWAFLALLAMYEKNVDKARALLRTARQAGQISPDINEEMTKVMAAVPVEGLPEKMMKNLCLCEYY